MMPMLDTPAMGGPYTYIIPCDANGVPYTGVSPLPVSANIAAAIQSIADGADITQGSTGDAVWSGIGSATIVAILKKIATSGSGGGPVTAVLGAFVDGSIVTIGAIADAAWTLTGSGTLVAVTKKIALLLSAGISISNFPATQPVSGTVTANAGSSLNTSLLALETGGNLAASKADLDTIVTNTSRIPAVGQSTMAGSQPVVIASNQSTINVNNNVASVGAALAQANQIPVANSSPQGEVSISSPPTSISANTDTSITFASAVRRIRIQNESSNPLYWRTDAAASTASSSVPSSTGVEWLAVQTSVLHLFISALTNFNASGGIKVVGYA